MIENSKKLNLNTYTFEQLSEFVTEELGLPKYRTNQIWKWIWAKNILDFEEMTDVSKVTRQLLAQKAYLSRPEIVKTQKSKDGTIKLLLQLEDGACVESVLIPSLAKDANGKMTQCLSTQVGCAMACTFCSTGQLGFTRNMTMGEIVGQVQAARNYLKDDHPERPIIRNLVYMGMGEPLLNFKNVLDSLKTLHNTNGLAFSARRITVSTCGIEKGLLELGESNLCYLAVSLHAPNQKIREKLMPKAANWKFDDLIRTLENYPLTTREHMTLEYLVIGDLNDSIQDAKELAKLCLRLKAKINLIPYNNTPNSTYKAPSKERLLAFEKILWDKKIVAIIRKSKGQDIDAACGQLAGKGL